MRINPVNLQSFKGGSFVVQQTVRGGDGEYIGKKDKKIDVDHIKEINGINNFSERLEFDECEIVTDDGEKYRCRQSYLKVAEMYQLLKNTPGKGNIFTNFSDH